MGVRIRGPQTGGYATVKWDKVAARWVALVVDPRSRRLVFLGYHNTTDDAADAVAEFKSARDDCTIDG